MMKKMRKFVTCLCATLISLGSVGINAAAIDVNDTNVTRTDSKAEATVTLWGDSNCDEDVTMNDAVKVLKYVALPTRYGVDKAEGISQKGFLQSDVYQNGDGVNGMDALSIMLYVAGDIKSLPESYLVPPTTTTVVTTVTTTTTTKATTTTAKATTTTSTKPTTTTSTTTKATTTTTAKSTTTTSTTTTKATTTTAAKPTTTTSTSTTKATTTTTAKPTTTTSTTTTKAKPTTTTSTSTTKATTTTTTKVTTTTTAKPTTTTSTTTTTTTTSTSTTTTITTTTTTTPGSWTPPAREDLINERDEMISEDRYNILLNTAKLFGIDRYKIVWSDHPIENAYTDPGLYYCMSSGLAYGYGVQVVAGYTDDSVTNIEILAPSIEDSLAFMMEDYFCYRPLVEADNSEEVLSSFNVSPVAYKSDGLVLSRIDDIDEPTNVTTTYLDALEFRNMNNEFEFINWYLIPIDENGNEVLELNACDNLDTSVAPAATSEYWLNYNDLNPDMRMINREQFYRFLYTAKQLNMSGFKFEFASTEDQIKTYCFMIKGYAGLNVEGALQVQTNEDVFSRPESELGDLSENELFYKDNPSHPFMFVTSVRNCIGASTTEGIAFYAKNPITIAESFMLIPLDEDGNEDLRIMF